MIFYIFWNYFIFKKPVSSRAIIGTLAAFAGVVLLFVDGG